MVNKKITINGNGNANHLMNMLAWIELLGNVGHSADFKVFVDGDGNSRWKFKFDEPEDQKAFDELRKKLLREFLNKHADIDRFVI